jgi:hypothetical protein
MPTACTTEVGNHLEGRESFTALMLWKLWGPTTLAFSTSSRSFLSLLQIFSQPPPRLSERIMRRWKERSPRSQLFSKALECLLCER